MQGARAESRRGVRSGRRVPPSTPPGVWHRAMRVLLVGAGAVGQVYGLHLQRAGVEVGLLVKAKYRAECEGGFTLFDRNRSSARHTLKPAHVFDDPMAAAAAGWDACVLCFPSDGLDAEWVPAFLGALGDATVLSLQPGMKDRERMGRWVAAPKLLFGMISVVAYHAPLPGEASEPGMAFWYPPGMPAGIQGPADRAAPLVAAFRKGGQPATHSPNVTNDIVLKGSALTVVIGALEAADWSFATLTGGPLAQVASEAVREGVTAAAKKNGLAVPFWVGLVRPTTLKLLTMAAPVAVPFPLETYLKAHFTKVGVQGRRMLQGLVDAGEETGVATPSVARLLETRGGGARA